LEALGYELDEEAEYPGAALFHGNTFEIFPAGALGPYRVEHSDQLIQRIVAVDPGEHDTVSETKDLLIDPMSERLALEGKRRPRLSLIDYCGRAQWIADAEVPAHADSWLSTIEEAGGRTEAERDYLGRADWKKLTKRISILPRRATFKGTPDFSKMTSPRKALPAFEVRDSGSRLIFVASVEEDLRAMERMGGVKTERYADWDQVKNGRSAEGALLADFDAGFVDSGASLSPS
jgi:transcription-repair coupling factor (superfamily II helicase)